MLFVAVEVFVADDSLVASKTGEFAGTRDLAATRPGVAVVSRMTASSGPVPVQGGHGRIMCPLVGSEHAARVARSTRMMIAGRSILCTWCFLSSLRVDFHSTWPSSHSSHSSFRDLGALATLSMPCLRTSGSCSPGPVEVKIPAGARRGFWAICCNAPELFRSVGVTGSGAPVPRPCSGLGLPLRRWQWRLPSRPWPRPVSQPIPWPFGRRPVGR